MLKDEKAIFSGLFFLLLGGGLTLYSLLTLRTGSALSMGPGFFPVSIGVCLVICGLATFVSAGSKTTVNFKRWPWRQILMILAAIVLFAVGLDYVGFLAACFMLVFLTALARRETSLLHAAITALAMTAFSTAVFVWALNIPFKLY